MLRSSCVPVPLIAERLGEVLEYHPETGVFRWRVKADRAHVGDVAGYHDPRIGLRSDA